jgi:hypothetical protein
METTGRLKLGKGRILGTEIIKTSNKQTNKQTTLHLPNNIVLDTTVMRSQKSWSIRDATERLGIPR